MARMSIDDKLLRDPRVLRLARACGWSRRETVGALLDVFAVAYDRERDVLPAADIDVAAERDGFADLMFEVDLAEQARGGVRIKGAKERIRYLSHKVEAGRQGGLKSGESRRKSAKQNRSKPEARGNPPDPVPDPVPEDQNPPPARDPAVPAPATTPVPAVPPPATGSAATQATPSSFDPAEPFVAARDGLGQRIAHRDVKPGNALQPRPEPTLDQLWAELEQARERAAAHHRVTLGPLLAHDARRHDLANLLAESARVGERSRLVGQIRHAIAVAESEALADRDQLQWLSGAVFSERNFGRLVAAPAPRKRAGPQAAPPRARAQAPPAIPRDQLAGPEQFAEARKLLAAVTSNDDETPDDERKPRKAKSA